MQRESDENSQLYVVCYASRKLLPAQITAFYIGTVQIITVHRVSADYVMLLAEVRSIYVDRAPAKCAQVEKALSPVSILPRQLPADRAGKYKVCGKAVSLLRRSQGHC